MATSITFTPEATAFIERVLALSPRLAVVDCDGTLWPNDSGRDFFYWEIERGILPRKVGEAAIARYREYEAGRVDEVQMCGEMVTINAGVPVEKLERESAAMFKAVVEPAIFPEMRELLLRLKDSGCELWAVSSTNEWVVREGVRSFGVPPDHVLAACVQCESGCATGTLINVPSGEFKARAIERAIGRGLDVVMGNSVHDLAMLEMAAHPFAINPNLDLERIARERGWPVYRPKAVKP